MKKFLSLVAFGLFSTSLQAQIKVALVFDIGGKNDRSFNQSAWEGSKKAEKDLKVMVKDVEPADTTAVQETFRNFANQNFDIIFGIGYAHAPSIEKVAKEFPKIHFALVDSMVDLPNVASLVFKEQEGSFLVGALAAMRAQEKGGKKTLGFIGGMDIPLIHKFELGYVQGAKAIDPNVEVIVNYVGNTPTAWNDPAKAKEIANAQIAKGANVIYAAAGGSGNGLFDAVKEKNGEGVCLPEKKTCIYAIGVDANQNYILPGQILTSMTKRVDVAVYETIKAQSQGKFKGGLQLFGLESNGVGYALDNNNKALISKEMILKVEDLKKKIISKKITIKSEK